MKKMLARSAMVILFGIMLSSPQADAEEKFLTMSTTTSTQASGLLDVLLPEFKNDAGIVVKVIAKGTGAAIRDGMDGNVDLIFVHAVQREEQFVADGYGTKRYPVMHNDFIIVGPGDDPAGIKGLNEARTALEKIAGKNAPFVSRGDDSGTHTKEQELWQMADVPIVNDKTEIIKNGSPYNIEFIHPKGLGEWYLSIGQGMGKTLTFAAEKQAYTLADRGTFLKYKLGRSMGLDLEILCEGDPKLANPYGIIPLNPEKFPHVKYKLAMTFIDWLTSEKGQKFIADYKIFGNQLFYPDAAKIDQ